MLRTSFAALFVSLFITGAAFADQPSVSGQPDAQHEQPAAKLSDTFSVLHAVSQWSTELSDMADQKAKSDQVKNYARSMASANANMDQKLQSIAQKHGIKVAPLDSQSEEGKSILERIQGEKTLLGSLQGDAFDKQYMTLVTNTQQSVIRLLDASKPLATNQEVKQFLSDTVNTVQNRVKTAQDVMGKVYGNSI